MKLLRFTAPLTAAAADTKRQTALTVESRAGESGYAVRVRVFSDYSAEPLTLAASDLCEGASLALLVLPWRIELWADGWLRDEEWPCGTLFLTDVPDEAWAAAGITADSAPDNHDRANLTLRAPDFKTDCGISANDAPERIIGQLLSQNGENPAERWKPSDPGVFAGDCMPYTDTDPDGVERYHVLYLKDRRHHRSKWHKGAHQWAHMSTRDFKNGDLHPLAVSVDDPAEGSICTGSWLRTADGTHYLYYTVRQIDASPAPILRSVSEDGYAFRRDPEFRIELSDRYHGPSARDPKIVRSKDRAEDGRFHMFVTTSLMTGEFAGRGCLAHLISQDGKTWEETEPIYVSPDGDQPECSDYFALNGWYYLIFSHRGRGQYRISRKPFSDWRMPENPDIPCESVPKMALWNGRILFTGFHRIEGYAGTLTFTEARQDPDGLLRF